MTTKTRLVLLLIGLTLVVTPLALAQTVRTEVLSSAPTCEQLIIKELPDAGPVLEACGTVSSEDGGLKLRDCVDWVPASTAVRNAAVNAIDTCERALVRQYRLGDAGNL